MTQYQTRVLLIARQEADAAHVRETLEAIPDAAFALQCADRVSTGLDILAAGGIDVVFMELDLPDSSGLASLERLRKAAPLAPIVVLADKDDGALALDTVHKGAQDYLLKRHASPGVLGRVLRYAVERSRMVAELEKTRRQQLRMKDQFLSHVSHELRTPLAAAHQFVTILLDEIAGGLTDDQRQYLGIVLRNTVQLRTMIDNLLEVTRSETASLTVQPRSTRVEQLIRETAATLSASAEAAELAIETGAAPDLPPVNADANRVREVLINLIENAIKFTPAGGRIDVRAYRSPQHHGFVRVDVMDTGCGVRTEDRERIFEYLYQGAGATESARKGLGLGLYISRKLMSLQGGLLWVEDRPDGAQGSVFAFTLPAFSLGALIAPVVKAVDSQGGQLALVTVSLAPKDGRALTRSDEGPLAEAWNALDRGPGSSRSVMLPRSRAIEAERETFHMVAHVEGDSLDRVVGTVRRALARHHILEADGLSPCVSARAVEYGPGPDAAGSVADRIEAMIRGAGNTGR